MQEQVVGFDPISIRTVLPWQTRLFVLYILVACVIWIARSLSLFRQICLFSQSKRAALEKSGDDDVRVDLLAASAIAGKVPVEDIRGKRNDAYFRALVEKAETQFLYLWEISSVKNSSLKRLAFLTLLLTMLTFAWGGVDVFREITYSKSVGIAAISGGLSEMFVPLTLGMFISTIIYVTYGFYEGALARRRASWGYFCSSIKNASRSD